jgi:hypothetical protein
MTFQISQRGKEYLETVRTLLRAAQTMTDRAIAGQLKALTASGVHDLIGSFTAQPAEEMPSDVGMPSGSITSVLFLRHRLQSFKVGLTS